MSWFIIFILEPFIQHYEKENKTSIFKWVKHMDKYVIKQ